MSDTNSGAGSIALVVIVIAVLAFLGWLIMSGNFPGMSNQTKAIDVNVDLPSVPKAGL